MDEKPIAKILKFPNTKGDRWRKPMAAELRRLADQIENDMCEPQIHAFIIGLQQGEEFVFGGCGLLDQKEIKVMTSYYYKFLAKLRAISNGIN
jgi:hypothetical protein